MLRLIRYLARKERAQVLPIMALLLVTFMGLIGLAVDGGRLFIAKTELSRAVDAAALAGVVELPDENAAADKATFYMGDHIPEAQVTFPAATQSFQFRVTGTRTVGMTFMGLFGVGNVDISATAAAGFGEVPVDTVLAIDSTGSMGASPCNPPQNNDGCPIKEAKDAASAFADVLLSGAGTATQVSTVPYRGCFKPDRNYPDCIPSGWLFPLETNYGLVEAKITDISSQGGTGTNVCLGLLRSNETLFGTNSQTESNTLRFIVILTDGDNTYNSTSYGDGQPPADCRPNTSPWNSDGDVSSSCSGAQTRERELDVKTYDMSQDINNVDGVEIYVVGFGVCGTSNANMCNTGMIGGTSHDDTADRNLLKCIASSTASTNDHYFEVPTAEDLPSVFQQIAQAIAFRLVE